MKNAFGPLVIQLAFAAALSTNVVSLYKYALSCRCRLACAKTKRRTEKWLLFLFPHHNVRHPQPWTVHVPAPQPRDLPVTSHRQLQLHFHKAQQQAEGACSWLGLLFRLIHWLDRDVSQGKWMVGNNRSNGLEAHISLKVARWWEGGLMGCWNGQN